MSDPTARKFFARFAAGQEPNGIRPEECGLFSGLAATLWDTYQVHGMSAAQQAVKIMLNDPKQRTGIKALLAGEKLIGAPALISARALMAKTFNPAKWIIPGILPEGVTLFAGRPKMGKSWLALNFAIAVASGGRALGKIQVEQGSVLYLALEDNERRLQSRMAKLLQGAAAPDALDLTIAWPRFDETSGGITLLDNWITSHRDARLVITDTLAKVRPPMGKNTNIYEADYNAVQGVKELCDRHGIGSLMLHHTNKGSADDALETVSGSFGLTGGVDGTMILKRERGAADAVLHVTGRDVEEKELALTWSPDLALWTAIGDADEYRISKERREVIDIMTGIPGGMSPKEVSDALHKSPGAVRKLLFDMFHDGQITQRNGKYAVR